jgi:hypothetical protein
MDLIENIKDLDPEISKQNITYTIKSMHYLVEI